MGNVFIIGNGFDLDLGYKTSYSDFANSNFWPVSTENQSNKRGTRPYLEGFIGEEAKVTWFDLENSLLTYSLLSEQKSTLYTLLRNETTENINENIDFYNRLCHSLNDYILYIQGNQTVIKDCSASNVLKAVVSNGFFDDIYSFNYTDLNLIAKQIGITQEIKYHHLHGSASNNSIILGVDETRLRDGYECFHKSSSRFYRSHNLYKSLTEANEIVVFGLSFNKIDYSYFDNFFKQLSEGNTVTGAKKQHITIFTKDNNSRLEILKLLRDMGINIQRLYSQTNFQIICTSDTVEDKELYEFYTRLSKHSRAENSKLLSNFIR